MKKTILIVLAILVLAITSGVIFMVRGLGPTAEMVIEGADPTQLPDGVYAGSFTGYRWSNTVEVTVKDNAIVSIRPVKKQVFHRQGIIDELIERVIAHQTSAVDTVSGATVSSNAFLKAVENALTRR